MTDFKKIAVPAVFLGYFMKFAMTVISWDPIAETKTRTALEMSAFFVHTAAVFLTWIVNYTNLQNSKILIWLSAIACGITGKG